MYVKEEKGWTKHGDFMLLDLIVLEAAYFLAYFLRHGLRFQNSIYKELGITIVVFHLLLVFFMENYRGILRRGCIQELKSVITYCTFLFAGLMAYMLVRKNTGDYSRFTIVIFYFFSIIFLYIEHQIYKHYLHVRRFNAKRTQYIMLVCREEEAANLIHRIMENNFGEICLKGVVLLNRNAKGEKIEGIPVVASREDMHDYAKNHVIDEVMLCTDSSEVEDVIDGFIYMGITVHIDLEFILNVENGMVNKVSGVQVLTTCINSVTPRQKFVKRCIDIIFALVGCAITLVATVFVGPIIYIQSPGPIFFTQERVGRNGRKFKIYKFRSMYMDAEERKAELLADNEMSGFMFKMENDPRITPIGHFIRKTSIDELPQFFNILKGDMSLVGTRPPTVDEYEQYEMVHKSRLATRPGLTGMWQVSGRSDITDFDEVVKLDNDYIRNWSIGLDIKIIWKTIGIVLRGSGAK